jgi:hypothetical protein
MQRVAMYVLSRVLVSYPYRLLAGIATIVLFLLLGGCMSVPFATELTEGQLQAIAADDKTRAKCYEIPTPYGRAKVAIVYVDKGAQPRGSVTVDVDCKITVSNGVAK